MSASESDFPHPPLRMWHLPDFPHRCRPAVFHFLLILSLLSRRPFLMIPHCLSGFLSRSALYFPSVLRFLHLPRYPEWIHLLLFSIWSAFPCLLLPLPVPMPVVSTMQTVIPAAIIRFIQFIFLRTLIFINPILPVKIVGDLIIHSFF